MEKVKERDKQGKGREGKGREGKELEVERARFAVA